MPNGYDHRVLLKLRAPATGNQWDDFINSVESAYPQDSSVDIMVSPTTRFGRRICVYFWGLGVEDGEDLVIGALYSAGMEPDPTTGPVQRYKERHEP